ncbi:MAG: hypothetical protein M3352_02135 [Bacteroidota bacterium]|nr:hypothetical protein [Bacteroidota bacterium]
MTKIIGDLFYFLVYITDILLIVLYFIFFKHTKTVKPLVVIIIYCVIDLIINYFVEVFPFRVMFFLYSFFTLAEYILFTTFFWLNIKSKSFRNVVILTAVLFTIFLLIYYNVTTTQVLDSIPIGIETILILIYSFYYLYEQMNDTNNLFIYTTYPFWIVTGIMIYLAGSFFIYIFANQVDREILLKYWFLTNVFYVIKNILFAIAILIHVKQSKSPHPAKLQPYLN